MRTFAAFALLSFVVSCGGSQPPAETPPAPAPSASGPPSPGAPMTTADAGLAAPAPSATPPEPTPAAPAPAGAAPAVAWKDMNKDQRLEYMKNVVLPKMKPAFISYDAKRYAEMNCRTCHGDSAKNGTFAMPNPKLPKVPATMEGFKKLMAAKPKAAEFMAKTVLPTMATLLGEEPFDPKSGKGFGCHDCHTTTGGPPHKEP